MQVTEIIVYNRHAAKVKALIDCAKRENVETEISVTDKAPLIKKNSIMFEDS